MKSVLEQTLVSVTLPEMGESVTEGSIVEWRKNAGDFVAEGDPLVEVTTDKVDVEVPATASGVVTQILAREGDDRRRRARCSPRSTRPRPTAHEGRLPADRATARRPRRRPPVSATRRCASPRTTALADRAGAPHRAAAGRRSRARARLRARTA